MPRIALLWVLFALQAVCCGYFVFDLFADLIWPAAPMNLVESDTLETLVTMALFLSLIFTGTELRRVMTRQDTLEDQIKLASGAFNEVMQARFEDWQLTSAEREVALLAIKGFSIAEMAALRDTKQGTIKAQCASVYKKADVSGRLHLLSTFLEDLMAGDIHTPAPQGTNS